MSEASSHIAETRPNVKRSNRFIDRTSQKFGRLFVLRFSHTEEKNGKKRSRWVCKCDCGTEVVVRGEALQCGNTQSCGCLERELAVARFTTHGRAGTPLFRVWASMLARCYNPTSCNYKRYGGRGIKVCQRWRDSFADFLADMGERPSDDHSIERKDNGGNYCQENCVWATQKEQSRNTRRNHFLTIDGVTKIIQDWSLESGVCQSVICNRVNRLGWNPKDAVFTKGRGLRVSSPHM